MAALTLLGVARCIRLDTILEDATSMMQLQAEHQKLPSRVEMLQGQLPERCEKLEWVSKSDCDLSKEIVDFIISQKGGPTGVDMNVARSIISSWMWRSVYGQPAEVLSNFDIDVSGDLSEGELRASLEEFQKTGLEDETMAGVMKLFDRNHDGAVTAPEIYQLARGCLVVRDFLRDLDPVSPLKSSLDLVQSLDTNLLHVPETSPENIEWHDKFTALSANLTAECKALGWTGDGDCKMARLVLDSLITVPVWNGTNTLKLAQGLAAIDFLVHAPDGTFWGKLDTDNDRTVTMMDFYDNEAYIENKVGSPGAVASLFALIDRDGAGNITREEVYAFARGSLVIRHFIPDLDPGAPQRLTNGSSSVTDKAALSMAKHIIKPPAAAMKRMDPGAKFLCVLAIMMSTFYFQMRCCGPRKKPPPVEEDSDSGEER